jgi:hypothetical protein
VGDAVHKHRGALDHLAFAISKNNAKPFTDKIAEESESPIFGDKGSEGATIIDNKRAFTKKIAGFPPLAKTQIQRLQPYQWGTNYTAHPLWRVHELSNLDKHRLLLVSDCVHHDTTVLPHIPGIKEVVVMNSGAVLKGETEILNLVASPELDMNMNLKPTIEM